MRVKRLEIQGFKSFKDKTVIHFDHCITGIVGPNGCGKSNIVDAFFWVMGEQSYKHMRGNSSEDLIFNGSSKYSPLGLAEATLVLETDVPDLANSPAGASVEEFPMQFKTKEVSVTRRLYRSGEGEYFINGTLARLKDIQELFMDTGVGAKGYSVIEQGQIGKIVNAKPEDRRLLIEEAAGIAKYKARKKESIRKMEATQANLARLTDIIQEIEKNLASLERQAQKARQYRKYKDELFDKEMTWGRRKTQVFHQKLNVLRNQREALEHELISMRAELQIAENSIEIDRIGLVTENKEAETLQAKIQDLASDLSHEKSALELSRRRQGDLAAQLESLENEQQDLQASLEADRNRLVENEGHAAEADQLFQKAAVEVRQMTDNLNQLKKGVEQARSQVDLAQKELMAGMSEASQLTSKAASLLSKADSARAQATRLTVQLESQNDKIQAIHEELIKAQESSLAIREQKELLQTERKEHSAHLQTEEQNMRELEKSRDESLRGLTQFRSRLVSLEELDQSHEGLADGPKAALDWAKSTGKMNQLTAFTDTLEVASGYESVLESWLENQIENLIVQDSSLALPLLEQIKRGKQGRVSVQIMSQKLAQNQSASKASKPSHSEISQIRTLLEKHGFKVLGLLNEFVKCKPEYSGTLDHLFAEVYVVESSEPLTSFIQSQAAQEIGNWGIVAVDGIAYEGQGLMRGGSLDASGAIGILKRKRAIEDLRIQVSEAELQYSSVEESVAHAKQNIDVSRARLQSLQSDLQALEIQSAGIQRDVHQTERALQEAKAHLESLEQDSSEMNEEAENAMSERETIELELQDLMESRSDVEGKIAEAEGELRAREEILHSQEEELQSVRVQEASVRERSVSLKRELEATRSLILDRDRRLNEIIRTLERASRERQEFTGGDSELVQKIEELTLALASARDRLSEVKDRIEQSNAKVNHTLERIKELHKGGDVKSNQSTSLALEIEKLSGELSHLIMNLEEKYGPGCLSRPQVKTPDAILSGLSDENASPFSSEEDLEAERRAAIAEMTGIEYIESETVSDENGVSTEAASESEDPTHPAKKSAVGPESPFDSIPIIEMTAEEELALGEEVERLRERIRRLGEVNVMAIEEYDQLKKRFDHLLTEKQDLEHSLENLREAIEHINKTSEERFKKAFEAIADRFERLFPIIFGGGQAKLSLVYPQGSSDILDAGVDILAQPPGKKVANITLLSGGEKALTAVSLIFAIFMVKPSPFCVLDEVDAPLDDANIGKFNALLREMSVKSQFILITHNKKTMELNDTLYGVTMEEPGVSKMVSIEMQ